MSDPYWFQKKWGLKPEVPMDEVYERLAALEDKVSKLEEECRDWFWASINEDDVYDKEFLEYLLQMVELGKVETYSMDEVMDKVRDTLETGTEDVEDAS